MGYFTGKFISAPFIIVLFAVALNACKENKVIVPVKDDAYFLHAADSVTAKTFDTLRNTLMRTVKEKGFAGAVEFCNKEANNLTAVYSSDSVLVKRTSGKVRNTDNAAGDMEMKVLAAFQQLKNEKKELKMMIEKDSSGSTHVFKPILVQSMCLNCHGNINSEIKPETLKAVKQHYPSDSATGYQEGDLRGMWHVVFREKK
ncbi:MAG: DUF3365 domain-containing protein [Lacibacter sp.]